MDTSNRRHFPVRYTRVWKLALSACSPPYPLLPQCLDLHLKRRVSQWKSCDCCLNGKCHRKSLLGSVCHCLEWEKVSQLQLLGLNSLLLLCPWAATKSLGWTLQKRSGPVCFVLEETALFAWYYFLLCSDTLTFARVWVTAAVSGVQPHASNRWWEQGQGCCSISGEVE